ncbi:MAG: alpha/beta hydrolase [Candidatus Tectomicrobia bacterium]|nr:alpha/beta hydrolase [Candidatus Tectomicrobia bacterium]
MPNRRPAGASRRPVKSYSTDLFTLRTEDGVTIDGALFVPLRVEAIATAVLIVHGKTSNFYSGLGRTLPPLLANDGISSFSINLRCHDLGYARPDLRGSVSPDAFTMAGGAWERLEDGHKDIKAGVELLRQLGYSQIVLCGHSSGGYYAVDYLSRSNQVAALVLLSPLTTTKTALSFWFESEEERQAARRQAEALVAEGRGHHLLPLPSWYWAISAASLLDRFHERQGWFDDALAKVRLPTLWLAGSMESRLELWRRSCERLPSIAKQFTVIDGADHHYSGRERSVYEALREFIGRYVVAL